MSSTNITNQLEGLEGFEALDVSELNRVGGRKYLDRGLAHYRQIAVEELLWDADAKRMSAQVSASGAEYCEVFLQVQDGSLTQQCDCEEWQRSQDSCEHAVAATAAMFLAVQGESVGGYSMPDDYAQELRKQLGYRDVGGSGHSGAEDEVEQPVEFILNESDGFDRFGFTISGPLPHEFLGQFGVTLGGSYGFKLDRSFSLQNSDKQLKQFLSAAKEEGIQVVAQVEGDSFPLKLKSKHLDVVIRNDLVGENVVRRLIFRDATSEPVDVIRFFLDSSLVLLHGGEICQVRVPDGKMLEDLVPLHLSVDAESFNEQRLDLTRLSSADYFELKGKRAKPRTLPKKSVSLELELLAMENVAGEWEALEFDLLLGLDGCRVDLDSLLIKFVGNVMHAYAGKLLSAKRRVQALFDLLRRVLSSEKRLPDLELQEYADDFEELFSNNYRVGVLEIVTRIVTLVEDYENYGQITIADSGKKRWLSADLDVRRLAMLLFSFCEPLTRNDLQQLEEGSIALANPEAGAEALQRIVSVCRSLGVKVRFNEQSIRSEPLSISVDTKASGSDIDWFQLHPSIRCGERTISQKEWQKLILGKLLIEDEDGGLIMPEIEGGAGGLELLAELLAPSQSKRNRDKNADPDVLQVSRLEMLDWIMLRRHGVSLTLPEEAEELFTSLADFEGVGKFKQPKTLTADLREYQKEGCAWIDFLYRHRFGACLADDMGLGKTVQAIGFLSRYFHSKKKAGRASVLIVLPPSLVFNWQEEFERFAPSLKVVECLSKASWKNALDSAQVVLTTYDRLRIDMPYIKDYQFEIVIFDEAHNLKNVSAARTKAAAQIKRRFTLCLTGTPVENNASEFYSVMSAAVPGIFGSLKSFKEHFREAPDRILGRSRPFILRRTKDKILKELPKKEEHELFLTMSTLQKEIYTRTVAEVKAEVAEAYQDRPEQQAGIIALAAILRLRQVCVSPELLGKTMPEPAPKFQYMGDRLEELHSEGNAALIFSQFIGGLDQMEVIAKERGISYLRMDGRTPVSKRKEIVKSFQGGSGPAFFFISLKTGGVGLNLTRANYVFHLDPWWNPAVENQASDRAHRIGQTQSVFVQRLIMQHSIEARMLELKARKAELFRQLVDEPGEKTAKTGLSRGDFNYLLNG